MKKNVSRKLNIILILMIGIIICGYSTFSYAKYLADTLWDYYLESNNFYFRSNQLNDEINYITVWNGGPVSFELLNYSESNEISESDIEYTATCEVLNDTSGTLECNMNGTNSSEYNGILENIKVCRNDTDDGVSVEGLTEELCSSRGYTWVDGHSSFNNYFEITSTDPNYEFDVVDVKVEAKSTAPYKKTITGEYRLTHTKDQEGELIFEHQSFNDYEKIIVTNNLQMSGTYFLRWSASALKIGKADFISHSINSTGYIREIEFKIEKGETLTFNFYKENSSDIITIDDFILVEKPTEKAMRITSISLLDSSSGVTEVASGTFTDTTNKIHVNVPSVSSTFDYEITIENTTNEFYHLEEIKEIINSSDIDFKTVGLSLFHEFAPGTITTFHLTYSGAVSLSSNELMLELEYVFTEGEIYKDEVLNGSTPEIIDGLLPIIYNESIGKWEKADVVNGNWYNYSIQKWANAASVIPSMRETYVDAAPGTVIEMEHMTSMLVWIPRFSYTIREEYGFLGYGGGALSTETPGAIDIKFVGASQTDNGSGSYVGNYATNYYTSSAFCWGNSCDDPASRGDSENTEIKGFWIAKFEASKVGNILYSKPNLTPMINYSISQTFNFVQQLMNGQNGYINYGYVGYVDAHLIKNTEWGAIAYLSQSKFGKYGNTDYTGANKEIYINNCTTYKTGIGGSTPHQGSTTATCSTNTYDTYYGMGASTTGNIYGVYDMVGGTFDRVMGILLDSEGNFDPDLSGFTSLPEGRYINVYPSGKYSLGDVSPIKGDALTETIYYYSDRYLGDPRFAASYYEYYWVYRGGSLFFSNTDANGIFSYTLFTGQADGHHSSRYTIIMYDSIVDDL